jgi:hypothetical protein
MKIYGNKIGYIVWIYFAYIFTYPGKAKYINYMLYIIIINYIKNIKYIVFLRLSQIKNEYPSRIKMEDLSINHKRGFPSDKQQISGNLSISINNQIKWLNQ